MVVAYKIHFQSLLPAACPSEQVSVSTAHTAIVTPSGPDIVG